MSIAQGSKITAIDINAIYTKVNSIITNYGPGSTMATLTARAAGNKANASDINDICNKFDAMKNDEYLGSVPSLYTAYTKVSTGNLI